MTDHEAGYLQAMIDTRYTVRQMAHDLGASSPGMLELLEAPSFLNGMIQTKVARHGGGDEPGRANENSKPPEE